VSALEAPRGKGSVARSTCVNCANLGNTCTYEFATCRQSSKAGTRATVSARKSGVASDTSDDLQGKISDDDGLRPDAVMALEDCNEQVNADDEDWTELLATGFLDTELLSSNLSGEWLDYRTHIT
jgi:hypothetical protein